MDDEQVPGTAIKSAGKSLKRFAIPALGFSFFKGERRRRNPSTAATGPETSREELARLFASELRNSDLQERHLTRADVEQVKRASKIRSALYGKPENA